MNPLTLAKGSSVEADEFNYEVTRRIPLWLDDESCIYRDLLKYVLSPTPPGSARLPALRPCEVGPIMASLRQVTLRSTATSVSETDTEILNRIHTSGEYDFKNNGKLVMPRKGQQFSLERQNWHARDERIIFDDESHSYFLDGTVRFDGSVSSAYMKWFSKFDANTVVKDNFENWCRNPNSPYFALATMVRRICNMESEDDGESEITLMAAILKYLWDITNARNQADVKGTKMHLALEQRLNGVTESEVEENLSHSGEVTLPASQYEDFQKWVQKHKLVPYRTEWSVYDLDCVLAGQIDSIWIDKNGDLHMIDWKRCKKKDLGPLMRSFDNKMGTGPCHSVQDNDFGHYAMQQNLYALILERNYDVTVKSMRLVQFHPTALQNECRIIDVPDLREVASEIMSEREASINTSKRQRTI